MALQAELTAVFKSFDRNGDGTLSHKELGQALRAMGHFLNSNEVKALLRANDQNSDGVLTINEFASLCYSLSENAEELPDRCPGGHHLFHRKTKPVRYPGNPLCNVCQGPVDPSRGFQHCDVCEYDVCINCIPQHSSPPVFCTKNHSMQRLRKSPTSYRGCDPLCDGCKAHIEPTDGFAHCDQCNFDLCRNCVNHQMSSHGVPVSPAIVPPAGRPQGGPQGGTQGGGAPQRPPNKGVKGLFIGINYVGSQNELRGCANDVRTVLNLLKFLKIPIRETRILVDDPSFPNASGKPTKREIEEGLRWLVQGAMPGDTLFLHYSGHGTQVSNPNSTEADGKDEALVPVDFQKAGLIVDDSLCQLVRALPNGVRLTSIMDCCHSGSMMDLPYSFSATRQAINTARQTGVLARGDQQQSERIAADVFMISGCQDNQTSADVGNVSGEFHLSQVESKKNGSPGGACTSALAETLCENPNINLVDLLHGMLKSLSGRFSQIPQLSSSHPIQANMDFRLF